jgi:hypothetical protein
MENTYSREQLIECFAGLNQNPTPNPMSEIEIDALSFSKYRNFNGEVTAIPNTIKILLAYDKDFMVVAGYKLLSPLFDALDPKTNIIHSVNLDKLLSFIQPGMENFKWNNFENAPSLIRLNHHGDQLVFIYVGHADEYQEYPICRIDTQEFCLWLSGDCFMHHIFDMAGIDLSNYENYLEVVSERNKTLLDQEYFN